MKEQNLFEKTHEIMSQIKRSWLFIEPNTGSSLNCLLNELGSGTLTVFAGAVAMGANCLAMIALDDFARCTPCRYPAICIDLLARDNFCANRILRRIVYQQAGKLCIDCSTDELKAYKNTLEHLPIVLNDSVSDLGVLEAFINDIINANGNISMLMICGVDALLNDKNAIAKLKRLSIDMNIPVVITYILNENVNTRKNHQPLLSDLPNDIRKHADTIILTSRPGYYSAETDLYKNMDVWIYNRETLDTQYVIVITNLDYATVDFVY